MRGKFFQAIFLLILAFLFFKYGIRPPIPSSLLLMFMVITFFAVMLYVSSSEESWREFLQPIKATFLGEEPRTRAIRLALFILLPLLVGVLVYQRSFPTIEAPAELRAVHPAPPTAIQFRGRTLTIQGLENPLREDAQNLQRYVREGAEVYYKNCFFCHGDALDGKGPFAHGFNPLPANFTDTGTIAQLQESYVFWRIAKGGPGLPRESTPWNSAMPTWEGRLSEEEIWKVIIFLYEAAKEYNPGVQPRRWEANVRGDSPLTGAATFLTAVAPAPAGAEQDDVEAGRRLYETKCAFCHGFGGKGDGPTAPYLSPRPRDFTKGLYKIRSTESGQLPTDQDLFRVITKGMPGTSMPAWDMLTEKERWRLVAYIKTFSPRFTDEPPPKPIPEGKPIPPSEESLAKGKELYELMECFKCHGQEGRADGPSAPELEDDWGFPIRPANLTKPWQFRGGGTAKDIRRTFMTGLAGTPMPSYADSFEDPEEDPWHLANYVRSLGPEGPNFGVLLKSRFISEKLPDDPDDSRWKEVPAISFPLVGQVIAEPRWFTPSIDMISVKSLYNGEEIAFLLLWDDPTKSLPDPKAKTFADAVAVQFPSEIPEGRERPYFLMGDRNLSVNLWRFRSDTSKVVELNASGLGTETPQPPEQQEVEGKVIYQHGQYRLLMKRALSTRDEDQDIQFARGKFLPIAFMAWDGGNGEAGAKMAISSWYYLILEEPAPMVAYMYPPLAALLTVVVEIVLVRRLRRRRRTGGGS